jgi:ankyrin repeat protein
VDAGCLRLRPRLRVTPPLQKGADVDEKAVQGAVSNKYNIVLQLLVTAQEVDGKTALHRATICGDDSFVLLLLECGSDINAKD